MPASKKQSTPKLTNPFVFCFRAIGELAFPSPRPLRVITSGPDKGSLCVSRRKKGVLVQSILAGDKVVVDLKADRVPLDITRFYRPSDLKRAVSPKIVILQPHPAIARHPDPVTPLAGATHPEGRLTRGPTTYRSLPKRNPTTEKPR